MPSVTEVKMKGKWMELTPRGCELASVAFWKELPNGYLSITFQSGVTTEFRPVEWRVREVE
jgi:hypothetical protein